jgi:hypothetical protein
MALLIRGKTTCAMCKNDGMDGWSDVPHEFEQRWREIFDKSEEGLNLTACCPVCGAAALHRYFDKHSEMPANAFGKEYWGRGSQWQWLPRPF